MTAAVPARKPAKRAPRPWTRDRILSLALIAPSLIAIAIFVYGMIGWTGWVSLSNANNLSFDTSFRGLQNFQSIFANARFQIDLRNTVVFTLFFVLASLAIGLTLATFLDRRVRGETIFRSLFLFPMAISFIVTGVVW